ncbi:MAG: hypothetical protein JWO08_3091 [Verrucomicrobiaceae bacterium]|nr:hypothetical protein [Verrucomicrobiaceae bacterium]
MKRIPPRILLRIMVALHVVGLVAVAALLEWLMTMTVRFVPLGVIVLLTAAVIVWTCLKLADALITAVDWVTRNEPPCR